MELELGVHECVVLRVFALCALGLWCTTLGGLTHCARVAMPTQVSRGW